MAQFFVRDDYSDPNNFSISFILIGLAETRVHITNPILLNNINTAINKLDSLLRSRQNVDGGWQPSLSGGTSDPLTSAWVGIALNYQKPPLTDQVVSKNIEYLLSTQNQDGTWVTNSGLFTTHLGTTSLVMAYLPVALEFLGNPDVSVDNILLDDKQLTLSAQIYNRGLSDIVVPINVTFYQGDPEQGNQLGTVELSDLKSNRNTQATLNLATLPDDDIYVVIDTTPATFECVISNNQSVAALVKVSATDPGGLSDNQTFLVNVLDSNEAPTITSEPLTSLAQGTDFDYTVTITDPDNGDAHHFSLLVAPAGLFIDFRTGKFAYDLEQLAIGSHDVTLEVTDLRGLSAEQSFVLTVEANYAPLFSSQPPLQAAVGETYHYQAIATDTDNDPLLYKLRVSPLNMMIDSVTGIIDWIPTAQHLGEQTVEVIASDGRGGEAIQSFTLTVSDNQPPVITSIPVTATTVGEHYEYSVIAIDPENDELNYELTAFPQGMTISTTGVISFDSTLDQAGANHPVTLRVTDTHGAYTEQSFELGINAPPVENNAPTIISTPSQTVIAGNSYHYQVIATDSDNDNLSYSLITAPVTMQIDSLTGIISWATTLIDLGTQSIKIEASDGKGGVATQTYSLQINDNSNPVPNNLPVITSQPSQAYAESEYLYQVIATDSDGDVLSYALIQGPVDMTLDAVTGLLRWTPDSSITDNPVIIRVTDTSGGYSEQSFIITISTTTVNNNAPTITSTPPRTPRCWQKTDILTKLSPQILTEMT